MASGDEPEGGGKGSRESMGRAERGGGQGDQQKKRGGGGVFTETNIR